MRFEKWQALGNDYLIVERDDLPFELTPARVRKLCQAHFGAFADGGAMTGHRRMDVEQRAVGIESVDREHHRSFLNAAPA